MKIERPRFELTRVYADGARETPEIIPVGQIPWATNMERRGFLGVGVGFAAILLLVDGKAQGQQAAPTANQTSAMPVKVPDKILNAHTGHVHSLAISSDGKVLISGSSDRTIKLWSLPDGKHTSTDEEYSVALVISPDGKMLILGNSLEVKLRPLPDGKYLAPIQSATNVLAISPDGKLLVTAFYDEELDLLSLPGRRRVATIPGFSDSVNALAITPDGKILVIATGNTVRLRPLLRRGRFPLLKGHSGSVNAMAISPDGKILASGSSDKTIKLWSVPDGKEIASLQGHSQSVKTLAISPDGKTLVSGSSDKTIKLWSLPEGRLLSAMEGHKDEVSALAISPDGKILVSGDDDGVVILWDLENRSFITFLFDPKASQSDAISYNQYDKITGSTITFTLPCGSPIPPGAVCTCNCVPGTYRPPSPSYSPSSGGGTYCTCNKVCTCIPVPSDRDTKEAFEIADSMTILQRLSEIPIQKWNYRWNNPSIRHIGPMAQDFAAAFAVGEDDKHICPVDAQGVAFAAIQGLYQILRSKEDEIESLRAQFKLQLEDNMTLNTRVETMERLLNEKVAKKL